MSSNTANNDTGSPQRVVRNTPPSAPAAPRANRNRVDCGPHEAANCIHDGQPRCPADRLARPPSPNFSEEGDNAPAAAAKESSDT